MTEKLKPCPFCGGEAETRVSTLRQFAGSDYTEFRVYCPKESKCHALAGFVLFVRFVFEKKHSRMNYIKLTTNIPNPTNIYRVAT